MAAPANGHAEHQDKEKDIANGTEHPSHEEHGSDHDHDSDAKVQELKEAIGHLNGVAGKFATDACFKRYLRARSGNVKKAEKMLQETLKWREHFKPEALRWDDVAHEAETGKIYRTEFHDKQGRTVLIMAPGRQNTNDHDNQIKHLVYCLENAILTSRPGSEKFVWLIDFRGWTLRKSPPFKTSFETLNILQNHYPERLGAAIVYDPPHIFHAFWRVIKPFVDPITYQKIKFVYSSEPSTMKVLEEAFDMDQLEKSFGGRSTWEFNFEKYSDLMRKDDLKAAACWSQA